MQLPSAVSSLQQQQDNSRAGGHWAVVSLCSQQSAATRVELQGSGSGQRNGASLVPRGDVGMLTC